MLCDILRPGSQPVRFARGVFSEARASGLTAVNITLGYVAGPDDPFEASVRDIALNLTRAVDR